MLHRFHWFGEVEDHFLYKLYLKLPRPEFDPEDENPRYSMIFCSPGGSINHGLAAAEYIRGLPGGVPIKAVGQCMSAGLLVLACGARGHRMANKLCRFMGHGGTDTMYESTTASGLKIEGAELEYVEGQYHRLLGELTKRSATWWARKIKSKKDPWYFDAEEAKRIGLIDRVVP